MKISKILILSTAALSLAACGEHTHSFGEAWKSDDTSHWHECECGEKSGKADHLDTNTDGKCDACNHEMEVPAPTGTQVTQAEWEAAFGLEKPYKIAENYKIDMETISDDELKIGSSYRSLSVDGLKARKVRAKTAGEHDVEYTLKTQNGFTSYFWNESQQKWEINEEAGDPTNEFASFLTPFGTNFDKFIFDDNSKSYKCLTLDVGGTICTNMSIKFENKKIVNASLESAWKMGTDSVNYHWQSTITYGGQTVTLPDIPQPSVNEVTSSEWEAAFGLEKPFLFADNYKFNMLFKVNGVDVGEENYYVDGNKLKYEPVKVPEGETLGSESYYSFENSKYIAYQFTGGKWSKDETSYTPMHDIVQDSLAPFDNPDLFTYDETSKSYKCETTTIVAWEVTYTNLEIKFVDKKITEASFTVEGEEDYICTLTYGGQTVTLPELEAWSSITYQEIKQAYNNKQNSPYNHREYEYIENNTTYRIIEDYSGTWVIDQEKSEGGITDSPLAWFENQYNILTYESVIDQATMSIEKNETEHKYRYIFEYQTMKQVVILDEYFNYLQCLQYDNDQLSGGMQNCVYSTVN